MTHRAPVLDRISHDLRERYDSEGPIPLDDETFLRLALDNPGTKWELHDGILWEKPGMSFVHGGVLIWLRDELIRQLDRTMYLVFAESGRLRRSSRNYLIPDVVVTPADTFRRYPQTHPDRLGVVDEPMPLVAEIWSPSTWHNDVNTKIPDYQHRGDLEIWRLHPQERTLTVWRRKADGDYDVSVFHGGLVTPVSLPNVTIDLDALFDFR